MSEPKPEWPAGPVKFPVMDDSNPSPLSHQEIFHAVHHHARAIVGLTEAPPALNPASGHFYFVVAYRWGCTNEHWYFVYAGVDQVKAVTMAENEAQDRGGKYGCAVFEFDESGTDYQMIFYAPSMNEAQTAKAPIHEHRHDYYIRLGMMFEQACEGAVYVPDGETQNGMKHTLVTVPQLLKDERLRQLELMHKMAEADTRVTDKYRGGHQ
jgi:hypothetical protein